MINSEILFFAKYGEYEHINSLLAGSIYFSNACEFRKTEEEQLLKGQGDKIDGILSLVASQAQVTSQDTFCNTMNFDNQLFNIDFGDNASKPAFCITAGTKENCSYSQDSKNYRIQIAEEQRKLISEHFPKADTVLLIKNPVAFVENVKMNIGFEVSAK